MAPTDQRKEPSVMAAVGLASGIGIRMLLAIALGIGLGLLVDRFANTSPWFFLIGMAAGIVGGSYSVVRAALKLVER